MLITGGASLRCLDFFGVPTSAQAQVQPPLQSRTGEATLLSWPVDMHPSIYMPLSRRHCVSMVLEAYTALHRFGPSPTPPALGKTLNSSASTDRTIPEFPMVNLGFEVTEAWIGSTVAFQYSSSNITCRHCSFKSSPNKINFGLVCGKYA